MKLLFEEPETGALLDLLAAWPQRVSSVISAVEVPRVVRRAGAGPAIEARAKDVIDHLALIDLDPAIVEAAASVPPASLRSLDAIQLASALSLGDEVGAFVAYDRRLVEAAGAAGVAVLTP